MRDREGKFAAIPLEIRQQGYEACLDFLRTPRRSGDKDIKKRLDIFGIGDRVRDDRDGVEYMIAGYARSLPDGASGSLIVLADPSTRELVVIRREELVGPMAPFRRSIF